MNKRSITSLIAAAALAGSFGIAHAQGSATAVPGTTNNQLSSGAHADTANGMTAADGHTMDKKKHGKAMHDKAGKPTTMNSNTNPRGTGTKENNGTYQTNTATGASSSGMSSTQGSTPAMNSTTNNSNTNPRGTGTMENNGTQPTTGGTK